MNETRYMKLPARCLMPGAFLPSLPLGVQSSRTAEQAWPGSAKGPPMMVYIYTQSVLRSTCCVCWVQALGQKDACLLVTSPSCLISSEDAGGRRRERQVIPEAPHPARQTSACWSCPSLPGHGISSHLSSQESPGDSPAPASTSSTRGHVSYSSGVGRNLKSSSSLRQIPSAFSPQTPRQWGSPLQAGHSSLRF